MLLWLSEYRDYFSILNVLRYPLFRSGMAFLTAFLLCIIIAPAFIRFLHRLKYGQVVREDGPQSHLTKAGTPTMGGLLILTGWMVSAVLWADLTRYFIIISIIVALAFGVIGFYDDYLKIKGKNTKGLSGRFRLALEFGFTMLILWALIYLNDFSTTLTVPGLSTTKFSPELGWLYIIFGAIVVVGTANAVNLTDGLDGLVTVPVVTSAATFMLIAYASGVVIAGFNIAEYLKIPHTPGLEELAVFGAALMGAATAFLWYNTYPAELFMGDVGSLSMGGALGMFAVFTKHELLSVIINGLFLAEAMSVILQVASFKALGKRIFKMAPFHHHFELTVRVSPPEPKVVVRFWIASVMLAVAALATLKLR
ncbi:MAG: phospho-N-acetylmuramoyl-pentapeptide-transferase [Myxococcota bacterium]